eukprot:3268505-Pyramimonas_sp.AAC.1
MVKRSQAKRLAALSTVLGVRQGGHSEGRTRPQRCASQRAAFIAIAAAWYLQTTARAGGRDDHANSGADILILKYLEVRPGELHKIGCTIQFASRVFPSKQKLRCISPPAKP